MEEDTIDAEILDSMAVSQDHFTAAMGSCNPTFCCKYKFFRVARLRISLPYFKIYEDFYLH